ncbi:MAG: sugar phosphate nucleotidyltransferase [Bacillota bacterium]|nr:sugar phosphate nucleotidyltransferase [Bacillota bacterium]
MNNSRKISLVEKNKKFLDILKMKEDTSDVGMDNYVVLMAGGEGNRLRPLTNEIPKPMLKVGNKPILEIIINQFKDFGFKNFIISINYLADIVEGYFSDGSNFGVNIEYIRETKSLGTIGCLRLLKDKLRMPFYVMNGDLLTKVNFYEMFEFHKTGSFGMTLGIRNYQYTLPYGVIDHEGDIITDFSEKPLQSCMINAGVYCLNPGVIDYIPEDLSFDITDLVDICIRNEVNVGGFVIKGYWVDIGQIEDYYRANSEYDFVFKNDIEFLKKNSKKSLFKIYNNKKS